MKTLQDKAGQLKDLCKGIGFDLPFNTALEFIAKIEGNRDLHEAQSKEKTRVVSTHSILDQFISLLQCDIKIKSQLNEIYVLKAGCFSVINNNDSINEIIVKLLGHISPQQILKELNFANNNSIECVRCEFDIEFFGGDYSKTGSFVYIPRILFCSTTKEGSDIFSWFTHLKKENLIYYNFDETYDLNGDEFRFSQIESVQ